MELPNDIASLTTLVHQLLARIAGLESELAATQAENKVLKARLSQNSSNSHQAPSKSGYGKKPALPKSQGKKQGGQSGHQGHTLEMIAVADQVALCWPVQCECGQILPAKSGQFQQRRQVFELPEPKLRVTEYQQMACCCPACGRCCTGHFPAGVAAPVQYGPGVLALGVLLNNSCQLSYQKISCLFADLFGYRVNESTLSRANTQVYVGLAESQPMVAKRLSQSPLLHMDETGLRVAGKLHWLHSISNEQYSYLWVNAYRGQKAWPQACPWLKDFTGWLVHDCFAPYFSLTKAKHALCGAHLVRELQALTEQGSGWARQMRQLLLALYTHSEQGKGKVAYFVHWRALYGAICSRALIEEPPPLVGKGRARPAQSKGRNLLQRLLTHQTAVLAFACQQLVPFSNNEAERSVRPAKTKQKVAGCFRTLLGAQIYARILSFISTCRKQGGKLFQQLQLAIQGNTFLTHPSLST